MTTFLIVAGGILIFMIGMLVGAVLAANTFYKLAERSEPKKDAAGKRDGLNAGFLPGWGLREGSGTVEGFEPPATAKPSAGTESGSQPLQTPPTEEIL